MPTAKPTKLETEALALFNVKTPDAVRSVLYALGLREACGRCGGSGHYSRNAFGSTTCYGCNGRRERAAKLTRKVLDAARAKVAAGELEALRAHARARKAAIAQVAPKVAAGKAIYAEIGGAYSRASGAIDRMGGGEVHKAALHEFVNGPLFRAQSMNNDMFFGECSSCASKRAPARGMRTIERDVQDGRADALLALAELEALLGMLTELRDAWRAWEASQRAPMRAAAHARLAPMARAA